MKFDEIEFTQPQRIVILRALSGNAQHLTIDELGSEILSLQGSGFSEDFESVVREAIRRVRERNAPRHYHCSVGGRPTGPRINDRGRPRTTLCGAPVTESDAIGVPAFRIAIRTNWTSKDGATACPSCAQRVALS